MLHLLAEFGAACFGLICLCFWFMVWLTYMEAGIKFGAWPKDLKGEVVICSPLIVGIVGLLYFML